jgi:hypothetical protein
MSDRCSPANCRHWIGNWHRAPTAAGTYYTPNGTTISNKSIRILGYVAWNAGLTTAGTYNALPTATRLFGPGINKPGSVVQSTIALNCGTASHYTGGVGAATIVTGDIIWD